MKDNVCTFVLCAILIGGCALILNSCQQMQDFLRSPVGHEVKEVLEEIVEDVVEYELEIDMEI